MNRLSSIIPVLALIILISASLQAQTRATPTLNNTAYSYNLTTSKQYAASQTDTLPQPTTAGVAVTFRGAFENASLVIKAADSCTVDIYVDARAIGATSWTNVFADSLKSSTTIIPVKEFILRNHTTESLGGIYQEYRTRYAFRATGNGNGGNPATKKYTVDWIWKP